MQAIAERTTDTLDQLATWRQWLEAQYSPKTVDVYWRSAFRFFGHFPLPLQSIREEHVSEWLGTFPYRSSSRRVGFQMLTNLFGWAERNAIVLINPASGLRVPTVIEKVPRALTEDEYTRVLAAAYARNGKRGATLKLLYHTGGRIGELLALKWIDVLGDRIVLRETKGGREREIDLTPGLRDALDELRVFFGDHELVLPRSDQTVWSWCRDAGRDAGIAGVHPHLFRSTAATRMLVRGARPHAVREVLGHKSMRTTSRYWAVEAEDRKSALELLG